MKLYFAGGDNIIYSTVLLECGVKNRLLSYHYLDKNDKVEENLAFESVLIDSGGFSAHTQGVQIDIDNYIEFLQTYASSIEIYANLDSIGDAVKSFDNFKYMKSKGMSPLPVFHQGEDYSYLEHYLKTEPYIALGGMVGFSNDKLMPWLDTCFSYIKHHWPVKIHGFGITSPDLMKRYPFYSVDSTSWLMSGRFGEITGYNIGGKVRVKRDEMAKRMSKLTDYKEKAAISIESYKKLEKYMTELWASRGIVWK